MNLLISIRKVLSRPYPSPESFTKDFKEGCMGAVIVTAILYVFRPFGMSYYEGSILKISLLFGGVSLIAVALYNIILRNSIKALSYQSEYNLGKWILEILGLLLFIAIGNWLMIVYINQVNFSPSSFFMSLLVTCLIGIIPIIIFGLHNQLKQERLNTTTAIDLAKRLQNKELETNTQKDMVLFIQAMENYINVYSLVGELVKKESIRRTLKSVLADDSYQGLVKCHRSYLINPDAIKKIEGNAQGLRINLGHEECPLIPVSRSYIPTIKALLI